jgi:phosphoenolpyruvate carboxylase
VEKTSKDTPSRRARDNERPLVEDIRLLGRILGDVIREQEGVDAYELVEQVRKLSVAFRRDADHDADRALKKLLKGLSGDQTVSVIRAFTYFSHLANLAEDRHHIRRRIVHERAGDTQEGSIEVALARLRWAGIAPKAISQVLAAAYVSPVLTAHPTEVQRKSILDAERDIAVLLTRATRSRRAPCRATHSRRASWLPTKRRCVRVCCSCGKRACCASPS